MKAKILESVPRYDAEQRTAMNAKRLDALGDGLFLAGQLEHIFSNVVEAEYAELSSFKHFPLDEEVPAGAKYYTALRQEVRGRAQIHRGNAPAPKVQIAQESQTRKIWPYVVAVELDIFELKAADFANTPLRQRLIRGARNVLMELADEMNWYGDNENGIYGVLNSPWTPRHIVTQKIAWGEDPDAMLAALSYAATRTNDESGGRHFPDSLVLSSAIYQVISGTYVGTGQAARTILTALREQAPFLRNINVVPELSGAGDGGTDVMFFYRSNASSVGIVVPEAFTMLPVQQEGFNWSIPCYLTHGGINQLEALNNLVCIVEVA